MRIKVSGITTILWVLAIVYGLSGCEEEVTDDEKKAQEERFFNLYMKSHFNGEDILVTESGLNYIEVVPGSENSPDEDDWMMVNYVGYNIPEEEVIDTYMENVAVASDLYSSEVMYGPFKLMNGTRADGVTEGLMRMKEGGKAILCFTSDLGFGSKGAHLMRSVPAFGSIKYEVELLKVIKDIEAFEQERITAYVDTIPNVFAIQDTVTDALMYYVVDEFVEDGNPVEKDTIVEINYKGYLIDGRVFDESDAGDPFIFKVGDYDASSSPIDGWHLGVTRFREGEKGRLIIPYPLAYGEYGSLTNGGMVAIPPYETLVFDIEIVSVEGEL